MDLKDNHITAWLEEIKDAQKREKDYRKDGEDVFDIYEEGENTPFNILYSNTETLLPALFSQRPRPVIQRRFHDEDPLGKVVSDASNRMIEYLLDTDLDGYETFDDAVESAVLDGLLPGRGITSIKYDADIMESEDYSEKKSETICTEHRQWDRVFFGYAKTWSKVPWVAFEEYLDKEEATKLFPDMVDKITFTEGDSEDVQENEHKGHKRTAQIWQIWDKSDRKIKYICDQYKDDYLLVQDDPLQLSGFFNIPKPIQFVKKTRTITPTSLYKLYKVQATELNRIQVRLNRVIEAVKVRGVYDGSLGDDIGNVLSGQDNDLIPSDNSAALGNAGGLDKMIWFMPIQELIIVARELMAAREACKQVIYEITGISDIVRGQSKASETLGAQKIKSAWGTMRLKRYQKEVQRYALDIIKIMLEIAANKFGESTWKKITSLPFPLTEEKEKAQSMLNLIQTNAPDQMQSPQVQQLIKLASQPSWGDILGLLKDDALRSYRVDIETNSTLDVEATEDKQLMGDFMNAMAQFMNGVAPLVQQGAMDWESAKSMMLEIVRRYRFGREVEDQLKNMQPPQPKNDDKEAAAERQKMQQEQQQFAKQMQDQQNALSMEKMQFDMDKKLEAEKRKFEEALAKSRIDMAEREAQMALEERISKSESLLQKTIDTHMRAVQSMLDKHRQVMKESSSEAPEITIVNQMPDKKSIKIEREDGVITGATVDG